MNNGNRESLFDEHGRRLPFPGMRVFNEISNRYYRLNQPEIRFDAVLRRLRDHAKVGGRISAEMFESACRALKESASEHPSIRNLFKGVHVPFICPRAEDERDLGEEFWDYSLSAVQRSFSEAFPHLHFKSSLQGNLPLSTNLRVVPESRYDSFLDARRHGDLVGWYFPSALQEFDIASQRCQIATLPLPEALVLSGGFDVAAALIGSPDLLVNKEAYPPVLCLSAFQHTDDRLMLCFKAYGQSLEFWCMTQMLTLTTTQVSEQWAGGLTLFTVVKNRL